MNRSSFLRQVLLLRDDEDYLDMRAKAKITIMVDCYDDHNEKVLEESHESEYIFDSWQQAHATYQLARNQIQERQTRERKPLAHKPVMENMLPPSNNSNRYED